MDQNTELHAAAALLGIDLATLPSAVGDGARAAEPVPSVPDPKADLTDEEALALAPYLPGNRGSDPVDVLNALIWAERTRRPLTHLPARFGTSEAVRKRCERWALNGTWAELAEALVGLDALGVKRRAELLTIARREMARGERIKRGRR